MRPPNNIEMCQSQSLTVLLWALCSLAWAAAILWLSLTSSPPLLPGLFGWDKLLHAGAYGLLAVLLARLFVLLIPSIGTACLCAVLAATFYGGMLEILQLLSQTGRTAEWLDLLADFVGASLFGVIFWRASVLNCRQTEQRDDDHG